MDATRAAALERAQDFASAMGRRYASGRNYDRGAGQHKAVSGLSPHVRRRLITEQELVRIAMDAHGFEGAEKFIQEVVWRSYFKGWLERRPSVWASYRAGLEPDLFSLEDDHRRAKAVAAAEEGRTGIDCFDAWAEELVETGYLHNHARMWFASIWIFTLGLPWRVGADFFYRHLLDGDPASNTLGWRWVAGLHTRGKAYETQAWNVAKFTNQRFAPSERDLASGIVPLDQTEPEGLPPVTPLRTPRRPDPKRPTVLLITEEDCTLEDFDLGSLDLRGTATLAASGLRSPRPVSNLVRTFEARALADAAGRVGQEAVALTADDPRTLVAHATQLGASQIVTAYVPEGPLRDWLDGAAATFDAAGLKLAEWQRDWDLRVWPYATAGFFKVKQKIPRIVDSLDFV